MCVGVDLCASVSLSLPPLPKKIHNIHFHTFLVQASSSGKAPGSQKQQGKDKGPTKGAQPAAGPSMYAQHQAATDVAVITEEVLTTVRRVYMVEHHVYGGCLFIIDGLDRNRCVQFY